jgi:hypothetical protein
MGVLTAASPQKGYFSKEHVGFFQSLAGQLGLAVMSAGMEEGLRLDESRLEAVWQLSQMTQATVKEITDFAMKEGSSADRKQARLRGLSLTKMNRCSACNPGPPASCPNAGVWISPIAIL